MTYVSGLVEHRGRFDVTINGTFDTEEQASQAKALYLREYHPAGYGTSLTVSRVDRKWQVTGRRAQSCD